MSTILKALEKNKNPNQAVIIEKTADIPWKLIAVISSLLIVALLATVIFLLSKPKIEVIATPISQTTSIVKTPVVEDNLIVKAPKSLVSEVNFITAPLPLDPYNKRQKWISADENREIEQVPLASIDDSQQPAIEQSNAEQRESVDALALENVSSDLQQRFALAVELEQGNKPSFNDGQDDPVLVASDISSMPAKFQYQVPVMRYDSHVYSTIEKDRWIRINGVDLRVGDHIGDVQLVDILPQQSVFRLGKQSFTLQSLQDWLG